MKKGVFDNTGKAAGYLKRACEMALLSRQQIRMLCERGGRSGRGSNGSFARFRPLRKRFLTETGEKSRPSKGWTGKGKS